MTEYNKRLAEEERQKTALKAEREARRLEAPKGKHCVYVIKHGDTVYVGRTENFETRKKQHLVSSHNTIVTAMILDGAEPKKVKSGLSLALSKEEEKRLISYYRGKPGVLVANKSGGGE